MKDHKFEECKSDGVKGHNPLSHCNRCGASPSHKRHNVISRCSGYGIECGRELDSDELLCTRCQAGKTLDDAYEAEAQATYDYNERMADQSQYQHLKP